MFFELLGLLILAIPYYLIVIIPRYLIAKKSNLNNPGFMFIPFLTNIKDFNLGNISGFFAIPLFLFLFFFFIGWISLGILCLFVFTILKMYKNFQMFKLFDFTLAGSILGIFFPVIAYWFIAVDKETFSILQLQPKYISI